MNIPGEALSTGSVTATAPQAIEHCPNCGAKDPGDPCRVCGQGRNVPTAIRLRDLENRPATAALRQWMKDQVPRGFSSWGDWMVHLERTMHTHPDENVRRDARDTRRSVGISVTERSSPNWRW